jgi:hypothetical protein
VLLDTAEGVSYAWIVMSGAAVHAVRCNNIMIIRAKYSCWVVRKSTQMATVQPSHSAVIPMIAGTRRAAAQADSISRRQEARVLTPLVA